MKKLKLRSNLPWEGGSFTAGILQLALCPQCIHFSLAERVGEVEGAAREASPIS
jgi:hypothetical protein